MLGHTQTPWREEHGRIYGYEASVDDEVLICDVALDNAGLTEFDYANAAFIMRACNAHDALVKALQVVRKLIDGSQPKDLIGATMVIDSALKAIDKDATTLPDQCFFEWMIGRTFSLGEVIDVCGTTITVRHGDDETRMLVCEFLYEHFKTQGDNHASR